MMFRDAVEQGFSNFADHIVRFRWLVIVSATIATAMLSLGLVSLDIETSFESYLPETNDANCSSSAFASSSARSER